MKPAMAKTADGGLIWFEDLACNDRVTVSAVDCLIKGAQPAPSRCYGQTRASQPLMMTTMAHTHAYGSRSVVLDMQSLITANSG